MEAKEEIVTYKVFEILVHVDSCGYDAYKWRYFKDDIWIESKNWYGSKGACLANFITEMVSVDITFKV